MRDSKGTGYYLRISFGKVGEDLENWIKHPLRTAHAKMSPIMGPIADAFGNVDQFGNPIFNPDHQGLVEGLESAGKLAMHLVTRMIPWDSLGQPLEAVARGLYSGWNPDATYGASRLASEMAGITVSRGYPGGPKAGVAHAWDVSQKRSTTDIERDLKQQLEHGVSEDDVRQAGHDQGLTGRQIQGLIKREGTGYVGQTEKAFNKKASPQWKDRAEKALGP
jgi:hypothetical protein